MPFCWLRSKFQDALKNILVVFAKLNPGIRYVQGMNELLAPLYYVFKNDPDEEYAVRLPYFSYIFVLKQSFTHKLLSIFRLDVCQCSMFLYSFYQNMRFYT